MSNHPMSTDTANVIVVVRMADDLHHLLGRAAVIAWATAAFFVLAVVIDLLGHDWISAGFSAMPVIAFGLAGRESWNRRRKYATFAKTVRAP
jgi:hypothetical protein